MRALVVAHQADAGPGVFTAAAHAAGWELVTVGPWDLPGDLRPFAAVMTLGGSAHPDQDAGVAWMRGEVEWLRAVLSAGVPLLGVCLGAQLVCRAAGGEVGRAQRPEIGWHPIDVVAQEDPLLGPLAPAFEAFSWHSYECRPPPGAAVLASSAVCGQAFRFGRGAWGIQFHAEVSAADALGWIEDYAADPDAVSAGIDPGALRAATEPRIRAWNALGRELCTRFLATAAESRRPEADPG